MSRRNTRSGEVIEPKVSRRSEAARHAILQATARLLETGGRSFETLTIESIAAEAGVGKQTIYRWWSNKAAVVLEAIATGHLEMEYTSIPETGDIDADLCTWMDSMSREASAEPNTSMAEHMISALMASDHSTKKALSDSGILQHPPLMRRLHAEVESGRLREDIDPRAVAAALVDPVRIQMLTIGHVDSEWARSLVKAVLEGVRTGR
ncbi:TetR/AcrR family transcriptional regulator [Nesterenkonia populi]|uniref:TetR/AcrR family transcriptional regulator n=1 Tax=Nesterenkonia populi TaxID=1591087 RepID=UPI0014793718|nr:TetR/AcrR family transcriptional regulator [Nesterenkonia populi]